MLPIEASATSTEASIMIPLRADMRADNLNNKTLPGAEGMVSFDKLYPAILQCFVVVASGYIAGRTGHISASQGRGIARFVSTFCLPALLFRSMCTLDFSQVNWQFLLAILIAKVTVFVFVVVLTLLVKRPFNLGHAGLFAIFCTQSNDFALGYPILQALYQEVNPEYLNYIYLIAPISLLILNPIGFILMEIHRHFSNNVESLAEEQGGKRDRDAAGSSQRKQDSTQSPESDCKSKHDSGCQDERSWGKAMFQVAKGVLLNPIVFMTAIGIIGNFAFNKKVPDIVDNILEVLGNAFSASALFYLGLSMVGKVQNQFGVALVVPMLLIFAKSLLLPLVTWEVVSLLQPNETTSKSLSMFGFLYGTFPTAPSVVLYASQYNMALDIMGTGMVVGTFLSAPLMFVSAKMMTLVVRSDLDYHSLLFDTSFDSAIVGIICSIWVLGLLVLSGRWKRIPHRFLVCLVLSQLVACIGMVSLRQDIDSSWRHYVQFITQLVGVFASRCWTAGLALALCLLHVRSLCFVLKVQVWLVFLGFGLPVLMTGLLFIVGAKHMSDKIDPSFHYGFLQTLFSAVVLAVALVITLASIVIWQRYAHVPHASGQYTSLNCSIGEVTVAGAGGRSAEDGIRNGGSGSPQLSPMQEKDYQACASSLNCSNLNIEDIVTFPSGRQEDMKSIMSDDMCSENHDLIGASPVPVDERTCLISRCTTEERLACRQKLRRYAAALPSIADSPQDEVLQNPVEVLKEEYQSTQHLLLLLLLTISMLVGLFLCLWKLFKNQASGIYIEIEFLDSVFNYGQAFLVFTVFGFDTKLVFSPVMRRIRRCIYGAELVHLPKPSDLDEQTKMTCTQFITFHLQTCRSQICKNRRFRLRHYQDVFTGVELCDWLIRAGLAADKEEAVSYGRMLVLGRVIAHVTGLHHFQYSLFYYRFVNDDNADC